MLALTNIYSVCQTQNKKHHKISGGGLFWKLVSTQKVLIVFVVLCQTQYSIPSPIHSLFHVDDTIWTYNVFFQMYLVGQNQCFFQHFNNARWRAHVSSTSCALASTRDVKRITCNTSVLIDQKHHTANKQQTPPLYSQKLQVSQKPKGKQSNNHRRCLRLGSYLVQWTDCFRGWWVWFSHRSQVEKTSANKKMCLKPPWWPA